MIDLTADNPISLTAAARNLPKIDGKRPHTSTIWRWCRRGIRGVRLEYAKVGGRIVTTSRCLNEFAARLAAADDPPTRPAFPAPTPRKRTEAQRQRDIAKAERELSAAGI